MKDKCTQTETNSYLFDNKSFNDLINDITNYKVLTKNQLSFVKSLDDEKKLEIINLYNRLIIQLNQFFINI